MTRRRFAGLVGLGLALALAACSRRPSTVGGGPSELTFSIASVEGAPEAKDWRPLLDDLSDQIGVKVKPDFAASEASAVEAMRAGRVQAGWFPADPALEAVRRADAEVLARVVQADGEAAYESVLIVRKGSGVTLDKVLACGRRLTLGLGEPNSTPERVAPMAYLFTPKGIDPAKCFKRVRSLDEQADILAVAKGGLDVATSNTVGLIYAQREHPELVAKLEVIWTSPPLPESAILVRKDLDPAVKEKIRQFLLTYGTGAGRQAEHQRQVLAGLDYGGFRPADESYLDPVRELEAAEALAEARRSGDRARLAAAQKSFDEIHAAAAQKRAAHPDL
ncbi:MAG: phosphate/phosphite/phosphonate ABC transporter substrate-binding protein [Alphaproteobacteria bacterium]|nr:phosphate/phosphite/phosphonate ABC transporter substrate-binding protein [Alphaproteobacteria bacterium]